MNLPKPNSIMQRLLLTFVVSTTVACSCPSNVRPPTNVLPKVEPLSEEVSQAMQADSTPLLKRADSWYENSGRLLDSVNDSSEP